MKSDDGKSKTKTKVSRAQLRFDVLQWLILRAMLPKLDIDKVNNI